MNSQTAVMDDVGGVLCKKPMVTTLTPIGHFGVVCVEQAYILIYWILYFLPEGRGESVPNMRRGEEKRIMYCI